MAISPNGSILAAGSYLKTRLWSVADPDRPSLLTTLTGHTDGVESVAFSPDGRMLATGSLDTTVRLWDITDPRHPGPPTSLTGHVDAITSVAFSPDRHTVVTGSGDATVRLWDTDIDHLAERVCALVYPPITPAEWDQYFPDLTYQPPCQ